MTWCERFWLEGEEKSKYLVSKAEWYGDVIAESSILIVECLNCLYNQDCNVKYDLVRLLEKNNFKS